MASRARKELHALQRIVQGKIAKREPKSPEESQKAKTLENIKNICGREFRLQMAEGKNPTVEKLFEGLDRRNKTLCYQMGITDAEIIAKIREGIIGKVDKLFKANIKLATKFAPQGVEDKLRKQVLDNLRESVTKKYLYAKLEGKTLSVEELYNLQKETWEKKSKLDMLEMYSKMGITEEEIKKIIQEAIDNCV